MARLDPFKLVFEDETSTPLGLKREYAYAPVGQRVHSEYLRNYGPNRTLLSALSLDGMLPSFLLDGGVTGAAFAYYLGEILLPALRPGQILILDNLAVHHGPHVAQRAAQAGIDLLYLPANSPDLNPIEPIFAKLKAVDMAGLMRTKPPADLSSVVAR